MKDGHLKNQHFLQINNIFKDAIATKLQVTKMYKCKKCWLDPCLIMIIVVEGGEAGVKKVVLTSLLILGYVQFRPFIRVT